MLKKFSMPFAAALAALGMVLVFAPTASASNSGSQGCTHLNVEYDHSSGSARYVKWIHARSICAGGYSGHHDFYGAASASGPSGWGPPDFRVYINQWVGVGTKYCARGWQNNNNGTWTKRGDICVPVA